mmetsp:Transcript_10035/g.22153  ORF Transcript_10035/g.22153 Transcript_10035/m.22153 type:complete len:121 (+) Transcript_10035:72-434(+)
MWIRWRRGEAVVSESESSRLSFWPLGHNAEVKKIKRWALRQVWLWPGAWDKVSKGKGEQGSVGNFEKAEEGTSRYRRGIGKRENERGDMGNSVRSAHLRLGSKNAATARVQFLPTPLMPL